MSSSFEKAGARVFGGCKVLLAAAKGNTASAAKLTTKSSPSAGGAPKRLVGIMKPLPVSPALGSFLGGASEASRPEVVKKIWAHIKIRGLQCPSNRRVITCDDKLKTIFAGREKVGMMEMAKLLTPHFVKKANQ